MTETDTIAARVAALTWETIAAEVDAYGAARIGPLLTASECEALAALYETDAFRSRVAMARHGFGSGEYQYFADPLPDSVVALRAALYPHAAAIANGWAARLGTAPWPQTLRELRAMCAESGQTKPTPLLLKYVEGDYNCLHQDLYGDIVFPLQLVVLLTDPAEFDGGAFVLTEQRPRMQSRAEVITMARGEAVLFATAIKPRRGKSGDHRVNLRHGVSRLTRGTRMTLGVIFHNAR